MRAQAKNGNQGARRGELCYWAKEPANSCGVRRAWCQLAVATGCLVLTRLAGGGFLIESERLMLSIPAVQHTQALRW
jgi:hypothetical protein